MRGAIRGNFFMLSLIIYQIAAFLVLSETLGRLAPFSLEVMFVIVAATSVIIFFPPVVVYAIMNRWRISELFPFKKLNCMNIFFILLVVIASQPIAMAMSGISAIFFPNTVGDMVHALNSASYLATVVVVCVFPAIFEELPLRGIIQAEYKSSPLWMSALINGLFFGIIHLSFQQFLYAFFLGVVLFYLVHITGSIISAILAHFLFNFIQVSISAFLLNQGLVDQVMTADMPAPTEFVAGWIAMIVIFMPVLGLILWSQTLYNKNLNRKVNILKPEAVICERPVKEITSAEYKVGKNAWLITFFAIILVYAWFMITITMQTV